ncbi:MAG TPA: hypothetical protein EYG86_00880 [Crocinitomicaceae bacterium]|nr:hypothetical protein [Crocinitomicaceae bacterium]
MKNILLISIAIATSFAVNAQSGKLKKADNYYSKIAYANAAELYTELIGSEVDSPKLKSKLADCYYQMGETEKSEDYYTQMISSSEATSQDVYNYAQSLKENGKYAESDKWMDKFHSMKSSDLRVKEFVSNKTYVQQIESQGAYFKINLLKVNTEYADFGGYPYGNESYFVTNRKKRVSVKRFHTWNNKKFLDLYKADIATNGELENASFLSRKANKKFHEGPLCFTKDGKTVYFTRNNMKHGKKRKDEQGIQNLKIYRASIDADGNWTNQEELAINSKDYSVGHPTLSADEKTLYFVSDMSGGIGGSDIYKMPINNDGTFGKAENLGNKINTEGQEMFPWMTSEGLLFFASDGHLGLGGLDVFVMLPNKDGSFKKLMNVGKPVNTSKDDFALIMNPDNVSGYVSSNRTTGTGDDDIYSFTLLKPLKVNLAMKGIVADKRSKAIIPGAKVDLIDASGNIVASTTANDKGEFEFPLEPDLDYSVAAHKDDYFDDSQTVSTKNLADGVELIEQDLALEKDPGLSLYALVTDKKTGAPLENVTMTILDNMTGKTETVTTSSTGDFRKALMDKKLDDRGSYNITLQKEGYFTKVVTYNTAFDHEGQYDVHANLDLGMDPEVQDLADLIEINPINFDLNKYKIRPDAAIELDKIVVVMNKYPGLVVELGSHTDCRASRAYNRKLSDRRAKASATYIKSKITNPERIYGKGYGESKLLNGCECEGRVKSDCSEEEHEKNRRTEFKVISIGNDDVKVKNNSTDSFDK